MFVENWKYFYYLIVEVIRYNLLLPIIEAYNNPKWVQALWQKLIIIPVYVECIVTFFHIGIKTKALSFRPTSRVKQFTEGIYFSVLGYHVLKVTLTSIKISYKQSYKQLIQLIK